MKKMKAGGGHQRQGLWALTLEKASSAYRADKQLANMLLGAGAGFLVGALLSKPSWSTLERSFLSLPGELSVGALRAMAAPHLAASVVSAVGGFRVNVNRSLFCRTLLYLTIGTAASVLLSVLLTAALQPGRWAEMEGNQRHSGFGDPSHWKFITRERLAYPHHRWLDAARGLLRPASSSWLAAAYDTNGTLLEPSEWREEAAPNGGDGAGLAGTAVLFLAVGMAAQAVGEGADDLLALSEAIAKIFHFLLDFLVRWVLPVGFFFRFLSCAATTSVLTVPSVAAPLALLFQCLLLLPLLFSAGKRSSGWRLLSRVGKVLAVAAATGSREATLPVLLVFLEQDGRIDQGIVCFVVVVGTALTTGGAALLQHFTIAFSAQAAGSGLDLWSHLRLAASSLSAWPLSSAAADPVPALLTLATSADLNIPAEVVVTAARSAAWLTGGMVNLADTIGLCLVAAAVQLDLHGSYEVEEAEKEMEQKEEEQAISSTSTYRAFERP